MQDEREIELFEQLAASFFHTKYAVAVSSGTAAIHTALAALGITSGDEVLVPALSVVMSVAPVVYRGATPVFVDTAMDGTISFDLSDLQRKISPRTKAVMAVHLWGRTQDMGEICAIAGTAGISVIEDACQAHGAMWASRYAGTHGAIGCFSMKAGKLISCGEGGFLLTEDETLARSCRAFRDHYRDDGFGRMFVNVGMNYRLASVCATEASKSLRRFAAVLEKRRATLALLSQALSRGILRPCAMRGDEHPNGYAAVFLTPTETDFAYRLARAGVVNSVGTFGFRPPYCWPAFRASLGAPTPRAASLAGRVIAITIDSNVVKRPRALIETVSRVESELLASHPQ